MTVSVQQNGYQHGNGHHARVKAARPWVETPLRESYALSQAAGCRVFLKLENLQPSGSFKSRGLGHYIQCRLAELPSDVQPHIFCSSGGNAGLAAVHASRTLGLPCTVVVPVSTKSMMVAKLRAAGAYDVLQFGASWQEADAFLREEVMPKSPLPPIYAPPFDHPDIWTGNSTLIPEIYNQMPPNSSPSTIICSIGGGGLFNGVMQALDDEFPSSSPYSQPPTVLAVETLGADSLAASVRAGKLARLDSITSGATSLGCRQVTRETYAYAQRKNVKSVVLTDEEAKMACWRLADDERLMVELACGVNVALCYDGRLERVLGRRVDRDECVVIVLCGGSGVTVDLLEEWKRETAALGLVKGAGEKVEKGVFVGKGVMNGVKNREAVPSEVSMPVSVL
ncbi:tryptophan synthase beta subunit-like PLP-dependent enzyme [Sporormia fimetaria CBS 119925]|uniref:L-serine ammonia-lyase n=1 Tax=Sporormia fimetaria CBS 119925 TaxID=1340428 RepID=A0A6A6VIP7_9PLEO|nr:tryptophan synthase beta subunit-like PLP-dependent enzyme [Sporormia fimetaria CBS 119925]